MIYVDTHEKLEQVCKELKTKDKLGIDIECENGLHHYGTYVALIQVSSRDENYIIDTIKLKNISCFLEILSSHSICKVFHDIGFDFRILFSEYNCRIYNLFDTQIAANFLGYDKLGLGDLLESHFNIIKHRRYQKADWTKRPISSDMLKYAVKDSFYLIKLSEILEQKLKDKGIFNWVGEEFEYWCNYNWKIESQSYSDLIGFKAMSPEQRGILKEIFLVRENLAEKLDRPVYFVISNKMLADLAKKDLSLDDWKKLKGVHPAVRDKAELFYQSQIEGRKSPIFIEKIRPERYTQKQKQFFDGLMVKRNEISKKYNIPAHLIASKTQIKNFVSTNDDSFFREWQKKVLGLI